MQREQSAWATKRCKSRGGEGRGGEGSGSRKRRWAREEWHRTPQACTLPRPGSPLPALSSPGASPRPSPLLHPCAAPAGCLSPLPPFSRRPSPSLTFPDGPRHVNPAVSLVPSFSRTPVPCLPPQDLAFPYPEPATACPQCPSQELSLPRVQVYLRGPNRVLLWGTRTPFHPAPLHFPPPGQAAFAAPGLQEALEEGVVVGTGGGRKGPRTARPRNPLPCLLLARAQLRCPWEMKMTADTLRRVLRPKNA